MSNKMTKKDLIVALENAIRDYKLDIPGAWSVHLKPEYVQLVWECETTQLDVENKSMWWESAKKDWGGDLLISLATAPKPQHSSWDTATRYTDGRREAMVYYQLLWYYPAGYDSGLD